MTRIIDVFRGYTPQMGETVFAHWFPRMIVAGADMNDVLRIRARVKSWEDWPGLWREEGDKHRKLAEEAENAGHAVTAGEAYRRAAIYYHYGHFMLFDRPQLKKELLEMSKAAMDKALIYMRHPGKRVVIPFGDKKIYALYQPHQNPQGRIVFLMGGADANKEEMSTFADVFLDRGLSVITVDVPGQGETAYATPYRKKVFDEAIRVTVQYINSLGYTKIGVGGISLGGYFGPRAAAVCNEFKASFGCGGPYDFRDIEKMGPTFFGDFGHVLGVETLEELFSLRDEISLDDVIKNLKCPLMIIHGTEDRIVSYQHSEMIVKNSSSVEPHLVLIEGGNHVCNSHVYMYRPVIADWMVEKLE